MMKYKFISISLGTVILLSSLFLHAEDRATLINSRGGVQVTNISGLSSFDNLDLYKLANEIDNLELTYKETILNYGNELDKDDVITDFSLDNMNSDFNNICKEVILKSQQIVTSGDTFYVTKTGLLKNASGTDITSGVVKGAVANNLSAGTCAWVDGHYIVGNGSDNNEYYNKGYADGIDYANSSFDVIYTYHSHGDGYCTQIPKYHEHIGNTISGGACYATPIKHTHVGNTTTSGGCYTKPVYHNHLGNSTTKGYCYQTPVTHVHIGNETSGGACYIGVPHVHVGNSTLSGGGSGTCYATPVRCGGRRSGPNSDGSCRCYECGDWGAHTKYCDDICDEVVSYTISCTKTFDGYVLNCNKTTSTVDSYALSCGKTNSTIDSYALNCGKTTSTIDSYKLTCTKTNSTIDSYYCNVAVGTITSAKVEFY